MDSSFGAASLAMLYFLQLYSSKSVLAHPNVAEPTTILPKSNRLAGNPAKLLYKLQHLQLGGMKRRKLLYVNLIYPLY